MKDNEIRIRQRNDDIILEKDYVDGGGKIWFSYSGFLTEKELAALPAKIQQQTAVFLEKLNKLRL